MDKRLIVVDDFALDAPKTKGLLATLGQIGANDALGTIRCCLPAKKSRNCWRISALVGMGLVVMKSSFGLAAACRMVDRVRQPHCLSHDAPEAPARYETILR